MQQAYAHVITIINKRLMQTSQTHFIDERKGAWETIVKAPLRVATGGWQYFRLLDKVAGWSPTPRQPLITVVNKIDTSYATLDRKEALNGPFVSWSLGHGR